MRRYQVDAAIQPGNSGGPLADEQGNIVGMICSSLSEEYVLAKHGHLPQNVNYAVKKSYIISFLDNFDIVLKVEPENNQSIDFKDAVEKVRKATVLVVVW